MLNIRHTLRFATATGGGGSASNPFAAAFVRACYDTNRMEAVPTAVDGASSFDSARAALVGAIRRREWERALTLVSSPAMHMVTTTMMPTTVNDEFSEKENCIDTSATAESSDVWDDDADSASQQNNTNARVVDIARLHYGVMRLLDRLKLEDQMNEFGPRLRDQHETHATTLLKNDGIHLRAWRDAMEFLQKHEQEQRRSSSHIASSSPSSSFPIRSTNLPVRARSDRWSRTMHVNSMNASQCQTELTRLLRVSEKKEKHRATMMQRQERRRGSVRERRIRRSETNNDDGCWVRAVQIVDSLAKPSPHISSSGRGLHAGHINACLGILCREGQFEKASRIARMILRIDDERKDDAGCRRQRRGNNGYRGVQPTSGTVNALAILVRSTHDTDLASAMLRCDGDAPINPKLMFPFAAWAACDALRRAPSPSSFEGTTWSSATFPQEEEEEQEREEEQEQEEQEEEECDEEEEANHPDVSNSRKSGSNKLVPQDSINNTTLQHDDAYPPPWCVALWWYSQHAADKEKYYTHLKLTSCIAKCLASKTGRWEDALGVMRHTVSVPGYSRIAADVRAIGEHHSTSKQAHQLN